MKIEREGAKIRRVTTIAQTGDTQSLSTYYSDEGPFFGIDGYDEASGRRYRVLLTPTETRRLMRAAIYGTAAGMSQVREELELARDTKPKDPVRSTRYLGHAQVES